MKIEDFKRLLELALSKLPNDLSKVYVELTWWDKVYKPLDVLDVENNSSLLVFGADNCSTYKFNDKIYPTDFIITSNPQHEHEVIRHPLTFDMLYNYSLRNKYNGLTDIKFLVCSHDVPINATIDINPFKTSIYENTEDSAILLFYASDGGSEANRPVIQMKADYIDVFKNPLL